MESRNRRLERRWGILLIACIGLALLSTLECGYGFLLILKTTPAMGIMVDAQGHQIPIQGYPQFWIGLAGACLFSIVAYFLVEG